MSSNSSKLRQRLIILCLLILFVVGGSQSAFAQPDSTPTDQGIRVIVKLNTPFTTESQLNDPTAVAQQRQVIALMQDRVIQRIQSRSSEQVTARKLTTAPIFGVTVDAAGLAQLQSDPDVAAIMMDELYAPLTADSNPVINAPAAWSLGYDGTGYAIAILDTGVDFTHPALTGKRVEEACFTYGTCPHGQEREYGIGSAHPVNCDACGHGTHVAGIAAGSTGGFSGVAPGAGIIAINVFTMFYDSAFCSAYGYSTPCPLSYTIDQLLALEYVYILSDYYNIASVNMSLGGGRYSSPIDCDTDPTTGAAAFFLSFVNLLRSAEVAVIAAAGNEGYKDGTMGRPACYSNVISVGAISNDDEVATFSTTANYLDLLAPGVDVMSSVPGGGYRTDKGTSMAAPFVSGAWAVARQAYPAYSVDELLTLMKNTGVPIDDTGYLGICWPDFSFGCYASSGVTSYSFTTPRIDVYESVHLAPQPVRLNMQEFLAYLQAAAVGTDLDVTLVLQPYQTAKDLQVYLTAHGEAGRVNLLVNSGDGLFQFGYEDILSESGGTAASAAFIQTVNAQFPDVLSTALDNWLNTAIPGEEAETLLFINNNVMVWEE